MSTVTCIACGRPVGLRGADLCNDCIADVTGNDEYRSGETIKACEA